jgi:hypothetical protein
MDTVHVEHDLEVLRRQRVIRIDLHETGLVLGVIEHSASAVELTLLLAQ